LSTAKEVISMWHTITGTKGAIVKDYQLNGKLRISFKNVYEGSTLRGFKQYELFVNKKKRKRVWAEILLHTSRY
jgi:hypothetical protein